MPLNCRDRRKRTPWRSRSPRICTDHGRRRREHLAERPGQMRIANDAVIINSSGFLSFSFFHYFFFIPPPFSPPSPPTPTTSDTPRLICTSRKAVNWRRSERGFFPLSRETQRDSASSVLRGSRYLFKWIISAICYKSELARTSQSRGKERISVVLETRLRVNRRLFCDRFSNFTSYYLYVGAMSRFLSKSSTASTLLPHIFFF